MYVSKKPVLEEAFKTSFGQQNATPPLESITQQVSSLTKLRLVSCLLALLKTMLEKTRQVMLNTKVTSMIIDTRASE